MTGSDVSVAGRELLSDLMDGRLDGSDRERALRAAAGDRQYLETWTTYHLIGDALRSSELVLAGDDALFVDRLRLRIESIQGGESPGEAWIKDYVAEFPHSRHERSASNLPSYRLVAGGFGAAVLVAVVAWFVAGRPVIEDSGPQLAQGVPPSSPLAAAVPSQPAVMIRDPRLDELLAAHKQAGGSTALQRPAGFLRNAAFDEGPSK